jgi:hypothetical protein
VLAQRRLPVPTHFRRAGMVICTRHFGRVESGEWVAHVTTLWQDPR